MKILGKNIVGYTQYRQQDVIQTILKSADAHATFVELEDKKRQPIETSKAKAREILEELTSAYSTGALKVCYWIVKFLKKFMFKSIEVYGEETKEIHQLTADGKIMFYLPNHKSHMDYLLLSYVLFNHEIAPPHIAAGVNLAFFPVGILFRKTGAYFIRRKIAGNFLYTKFLQHYFDWMLREKISQEFYMEGGRSRDGKIREAQSGIFTLFVEQILNRKLQDKVYLVPTGITYDRLPEMNSLIGELKGAEKETESMFSVLGSLSMLWTDHGKVHLQFGKPISLQSVIDGEFSKKTFQDLSEKIFKQVQSQKTTTVSSLVALSLLNTTSEVDSKELYDHIEWLMKFLKPCRQCISEDLANVQKDWNSILDRYEKWDWFTRSGTKIHINASKRMEMNYYKNDLLPVLMPFFQFENQFTRAVLAHEYPYANHNPSSTVISANEKAFLHEMIEPTIAFYRAVQTQIKRKNISNLLAKDAQKNILTGIKDESFPYSEMMTTEAVKSATLFFHQNMAILESN